MSGDEALETVWRSIIKERERRGRALAGEGDPQRLEFRTDA